MSSICSDKIAANYLPTNIWNLIWSFDPTYHDLFDTCLIDIKKDNIIKEFKNNKMLIKDRIYWIKRIYPLDGFFKFEFPKNKERIR